MPSRVPLAILAAVATAALLGVRVGEAQERLSPAELAGHLDSLSAFDHAVRTTAARALRRAPAADVVPALTDAVRAHADQFVRFRALVLLTAFNDPGTADLIRSLLGDRNDRLREVAYRWFERHPDPGLAGPLVAALETEQSEFVRPALVRAVAALPRSDSVQRALLAEVGRGFDFFRGAVIDALGQHRATYALDAIAAVASIEGPLQDDAVLALGRIGDPRARAALSGLQSPSPEVTVAVQAAECLLGDPCASRIDWLARQARQPAARPEVVRAAVAALGQLASQDPDARAALVSAADGAVGRLRADVALAVSAWALRQPEEMIAWMSQLPDTAGTAVMGLLREGFDRLEEDVAEEQFFAAARTAYWAAPDGSAVRRATATLVDRLEF